MSINTDQSPITVVQVDTLSQLKENNRNSRLIGLDIGDKRIGVSVSDTTWTIASPVQLIEGHHQFNTQFQNVLKQFPTIGQPSQKQTHSIAAIIVGLPLLLNADFGPQAKKVLAFCEKHLTPFNLPIFWWDERLSTHGANRILLEADLSRAKRLKTIDKMSAVFILQGVLDFFSHPKN